MSGTERKLSNKMVRVFDPSISDVETLILNVKTQTSKLKHQDLSVVRLKTIDRNRLPEGCKKRIGFMVNK